MTTDDVARPEGITKDDVRDVLNGALERAKIIEAHLVAIDTAARRVVLSKRDAERVDPAALAELEAVLLEAER